jgi:thymidylate synthase
MQQYLALVRDIFENGSWQDNRTGVRTKSIPGAMMKFDLQQGFPAVTTKKLAFKSAIGELIGFLRATRSAADFRALGCKVWNQNANENQQWLANPYRLQKDDIGPVYGVQWREWPAYKLIDLSKPKSSAQIADAMMRGYQQIGLIEDVNEQGKVDRVLLYKAIDQLRQCLDTIINDPGSRRILFHGWNWAQLEEMALPPCHLLYQFLVNPSKREISLCLYIRSNDVGLGAPFNLVESSALLHLVGRLTGYSPRWLTYFIGDAHIYENHVDMLEEQLKREPFPAPKLVLSDRTLTMRLLVSMNQSG